jgi:hypothetical protein
MHGFWEAAKYIMRTEVRKITAQGNESAGDFLRSPCPAGTGMEARPAQAEKKSAFR